MAVVCQACGDQGKVELLINCSQCQVSTNHRYCLEKWPQTKEKKVIWICDDCSKVNPNTCRKSERIRLRSVEQAIEDKIDKKKFIATKAKVRLDGNKANQLKSSDLSFPNKEIGNQGHRKRRRLILQEDDNSCDDHDDKMVNNEMGNHYFSNGTFEKEFKKQKSRVTLQQDKGSPNEDANDSIWNATHTLPFSESPDRFARPTIHPIWRGCFRIKNGKHDTTIRLVAHLSSNANSKVFYVANSLQPIINVQILPKFHTWPEQFQMSPPTDCDIGLYFFPESRRDEKVFDILLNEIVDLELALKATLNNIELLVFSSQELPQLHWRFMRKFYLWGAFRLKQGFVPNNQHYGS